MSNVILDIFAIVMSFAGAILMVYKYHQIKEDGGDLSMINSAGMIIGAAVMVAFMMISVRLYLGS
jgi:drug/metabolite transporter (DMT)-like permease